MGRTLKSQIVSWDVNFKFIRIQLGVGKGFKKEETAFGTYNLHLRNRPRGLTRNKTASDSNR